MLRPLGCLGRPVDKYNAPATGFLSSFSRIASVARNFRNLTDFVSDVLIGGERTPTLARLLRCGLVNIPVTEDHLVTFILSIENGREMKAISFFLRIESSPTYLVANPVNIYLVHKYS